MKKIILVVFSLTFVFTCAFSQDKEYLRFIPSNLNASNVNPSDIPSEQVLRNMGLSEQEITEAMNFKYERGKYHPDFIG